MNANCEPEPLAKTWRKKMNAKQREKFARKGKRAPVIAVMEQAGVHIALGRAHQGPLAQYGWPAENTEHLSERVGVLGQLFSTRSQTMDASRMAAKNEKLCIDNAKAFINRIRTAAPIVLSAHPAPNVTENAFKIGVSLSCSTPNHLKYLMRIRPFVETLDEQLKPFFAGESPLEQLDAVKSALEQSDALQETLRGTLPACTQEIIELNGEVFELIENMNRVAKLAFQDNPEIAAQFNKNLIQRATRSVRKVEESEEAPEVSEVNEIEEAV